MENKKKDFDAIKFLEDIEKNRKEKEKKFNESKIGDLTGFELKEIISSVIHEEFVTSKHPIINARRREKLEKYALIFLGILIILGLGYKTFFYESEYYLEIDKDKLYVKKTDGWNSQKSEMKVIGKDWEICPQEKGCTRIFTPFEAIYNKYYKFIFSGNGSVFWVNNEKTQVTPVKLIDGSWSYKHDYDDEWMDFDSLNDYVEPQSPERPY